MMTIDQVDEAIRVCARFLERAKRARGHLEREVSSRDGKDAFWSRDAVALRLLSLELTEALAPLRRVT